MKGNLIGTLFLLALAVVIGLVIRNGSQPAPPAGGTAAGGEATLMDFYADWCGPCKMMKPVVHELADELRGKVNVVQINVDENPELARQYNIRSIPCFVFVRNGKEVDRRVGAVPKETLRQLTGL